MRPIARPTRRFARLFALGLFIAPLAGGCASSFRTDADNAPPPAAQLRPTTMPSNEIARFDSVGGTFRKIFVDYPVRLYDYATGRTPTNDVALLEDAKSADRRRVGVNQLVARDFGKSPPYTTRYGQIAQFDGDAGVRATAIRALNRSRDGSATGKFIVALGDESPAVRLEAAKALSNVPNEAAVPALLKVFNNAAETVDIRIAAADALRQYRSLETARALVNVLNDRDFGLAWQARQSLRTMTGADQRYDQAAWLRLLTEQPLG